MSRPAQGNAAQGNGSSQRRTSNGGSYANGTGYGYGSPNGYNGRQQQQQHQQQHQQQQRNSSSAAAYYPTPTPPPSTPSSPPPSAPLPGRVGYSGAGAGAAGHSGSGASTYAQQQYQYAQQPQYYPQPYGSTPPPSSPYAGAQQHPQAAGRPAGGHHHGHHGNHKYSLFGPYRLGKTIGEGEFGKVKLAYHSESGKEVAIKLIKKESIDSSSRRDKLIREIRILKSLDHPYIVKLLEVIETEHYIGMIMEYVSGGELFEHILARSYLKEKEAATFFAQLIAGISYLHKNHIVHRDLKLENLLLDHKKNIIITDFGFANTAPTDVNALMLTSCGSPCYAAPELVINDGYVGEAADIWSCGVILYAMLCGYLPFDDDPANPASENLNLLYKYILETELEFPDYVPVGARALLRRILVPDPKKRANMAEIKAHFWLRPYAHIFENDPAADNIVHTPIFDTAGGYQQTHHQQQQQRPAPVNTQQQQNSYEQQQVPSSPSQLSYQPSVPTTPVSPAMPATLISAADVFAAIPPAASTPAGYKHAATPLPDDGPSKRHKQQTSLPAMAADAAAAAGKAHADGRSLNDLDTNAASISAGASNSNMGDVTFDVSLSPSEADPQMSRSELDLSGGREAPVPNSPESQLQTQTTIGDMKSLNVLDASVSSITASVGALDQQPAVSSAEPIASPYANPAATSETDAATEPAKEDTAEPAVASEEAAESVAAVASEPPAKAVSETSPAQESVAAPAAAGVPIVVSNVITRDVSFTTSRTGELQVVVTTESTVVETTTIPVPDVAITPSPAPSTKVSDESLTATSGGRRAVKFTVSDTESDVFATARADPVKSRGKSLDVRRMQTPDSDDNDSDAVVPSSASAKSGKTKSGKSAAVAAARRKSENQSKAPLVPSKAAAAKSSKTTSMAPRPSVSSTLSGSQVVPDMARLKPHNGPIDQRALSSKAPRELLAEVSAVLEQMGMEVSVAEGEEFKLRVVRPKAGSDHHHHRTALSAQSSTETLQSAAAGIADAMEAQTRPSVSGRRGSGSATSVGSGSGSAGNSAAGGASRIASVIASFPMSLVRRFRYMAQFGPRYDKGYDGHTQATDLASKTDDAAVPAADAEGAASADAPDASVTRSSSTRKSGRVVEVGEIRFHVSLHRIKNLPGLLVVDFKRLRGDIWEFKRLYHDVVAKLPLQDNSEYQI